MIKNSPSASRFMPRHRSGLTLVTAVRTAATITTSSAELRSNFARPKEGIELAMDCRVEDMVCSVEMMCTIGASGRKLRIDGTILYGVVCNQAEWMIICQPPATAGNSRRRVSNQLPFRFPVSVEKSMARHFAHRPGSETPFSLLSCRPLRSLYRSG
jgi:hypothetical protein